MIPPQRKNKETKEGRRKRRKIRQKTIHHKLVCGSNNQPVTTHRTCNAKCNMTSKPISYISTRSYVPNTINISLEETKVQIWRNPNCIPKHLRFSLPGF